MYPLRLNFHQNNATFTLYGMDSRSGKNLHVYYMRTTSHRKPQDGCMAAE